MNSVEDAYQLIADRLRERASEGWARVVFETRILRSNCSSMSTSELTCKNEDRSLALGAIVAFEINDACLFLRDDLLKTTGQRIWGLTFTLFPNGNFRIEYDYNKPEDYEETDETIEVDLTKDIQISDSSRKI